MVESQAIDLTDDGGVLKEIKTPGVGDTTPSAGCKVKVHYTGTLLDGTVFDSSKTRGEPFEFDLGKGQVIKAWDRGIVTMKKDEVALFTCKPEYAYGKQGSPPTIPPDATLVFEVEMISWEAEDISLNHDGGIRREILEEGGSFSTPKDGAAVEITLKAEYDNKVFQEGNFSFIIGEGCEVDIPESLEKALEKFKLKEKSRLTVQPQHLWKGKGNQKLGLPENTPAVYTITMNNFEKVKDAWQLNSDEKLEQGKFLKEKGTTYFKQDKFQLAGKNYTKAITYLDFDGGFEGEGEEERKKTLTACHLNAAMCFLKLKQSILAREHCDKVIELEPNSEKAYFRRGTAYLDLNEPELAEKDFLKVLQIDSNNKAAVQKLSQTKQRIKELRTKEKQIYANMFDKFAKHDTEASWRFGWWKGNEVDVEKEDFVETEEDFEEEQKLKRKQREQFLKKAAEMRAKREQLLKEKGETIDDDGKTDEKVTEGNSEKEENEVDENRNDKIDQSDMNDEKDLVCVGQQSLSLEEFAENSVNDTSKQPWNPDESTEESKTVFGDIKDKQQLQKDDSDRTPCSKPANIVKEKSSRSRKKSGDTKKINNVTEGEAKANKSSLPKDKTPKSIENTKVNKNSNESKVKENAGQNKQTNGNKNQKKEVKKTGPGNNNKKK